MNRIIPAIIKSSSRTYLDFEPLQIVNWFVQRWQVEVTFEEVQAHLSVEAPRHNAYLAPFVYLDRPGSSFVGRAIPFIFAASCRVC